MRSRQHSDIADEQEMILFGGLNASDSGFGGSSNVLDPDNAAILQVMSFLCVISILISAVGLYARLFFKVVLKNTPSLHSKVYLLE